jgi:hypothetical protein
MVISQIETIKKVGKNPFGTVFHLNAWRNAPAHVTPSAGSLPASKRNGIAPINNGI